MKLIKTITKGRYTLEHKRYVGLLGVWRDSFEIQLKYRDGQVVHYPFLGFLKANNKDNVLDATSDYTDQDYDLMLKEEGEKIKNMLKGVLID